MENSVLKTRKQKTGGRQTPVAMKKNPTEDDIRTRAFEIYKENGFSSHSELDDWLRAERELKGSSL